jgi:hypothetical protein
VREPRGHHRKKRRNRFLLEHVCKKIETNLNISDKILFPILSCTDKKVMFNTIDMMTNVYVDIPNRMFNAHAYVSSNLICGTTVHQEEEKKKRRYEENY